MKFSIPFAGSNLEKLKKQSKFFSSKIRYKKNSKIREYLINCDVNISREEYLGICIKSFIFYFLILIISSSLVLFFLNLKYFFVLSFFLSLTFSLFILFSQIVYPKVYVNRKQRDIEKNLIPALEDMLIQLNSGVSLFNILVNISSSDYGSLSLEFKKAVKRIAAGEPDSKVLNELGKSNSSLFFRRALWQISNGISAGSDMSIVVKDIIKALNEEQLIQIQNYGNQLNPLIVMYMLITVIIPTLSITFLTVISSMIKLSKEMTYLLYIALFVFVTLAQVMFLGLIKSKRPTLL